MRRLDRHRHYGHVVGLEPICWQQDGLYFYHDGSLASESSTEEANADEPLAMAAPWEETPKAVSEPQESKVKPDDMRLTANKAVRMQWESYHEGEEWPGLAQAKTDLGIAD